MPFYLTRERLSFIFLVLFIILFLFMLNHTQMTSHGSSDDGNALSHTDGLAREGFPRILWEVLQGGRIRDTPSVHSAAVREAPSASL